MKPTYWMLLPALTVLCLTGSDAAEDPAGKKRGFPMEAKEIEYPSSADETMQPAMFYAPETEGPVPLLVGLHS